MSESLIVECDCVKHSAPLQTRAHDLYKRYLRQSQERTAKFWIHYEDMLNMGMFVVWTVPLLFEYLVTRLILNKHTSLPWVVFFVVVHAGIAAVVRRHFMDRDRWWQWWLRRFVLQYVSPVPDFHLWGARYKASDFQPVICNKCPDTRRTGNHRKWRHSLATETYLKVTSSGEESR